MESSTNKRYSGRFFSPQEIEQVRDLIHTHPRMNRQQLVPGNAFVSLRLCARIIEIADER